MYTLKRILIEAFWGLAFGILIVLILRLRGQMILDNYQILGVSLIPLGSLFAVYSYFVLLNIPLTSFGLACLILGITLLTIPSSSIPSHEVLAMMEGLLVNLEALMEEFDVKGKAVYLFLDNKVFIFVPISENSHIGSMNPINEPLGILTESNGVPGVYISPPGSELVNLYLQGEMEVREALNHVLVNNVEIVESLNSIRDGDYINIELKLPTVSTEFPRVNRSIGSLPTSLSGCVLAYTLKQPIFYRGEKVSENETICQFEVKN